LYALCQWLESLGPAARSAVRLVYAGSDASSVRAALAAQPLACEIEVLEHLPVEKLAQRASQAFCCCYIWASFGFHHKLLELLATGSPVIAFPGEHTESKHLASQCETPFSVCENSEQLKAALQQAWLSNRQARTAWSAVPPWRWDDFAERLEMFFMELIGKDARSCAG